MRRATLLFGPVMPLSDRVVAQALQELKGWRLESNNNESSAICHDFVFYNFKQAMAFMNAVSTDCEVAGHHPTWTNTYNKLHVRLTTHDAGNCVTQKDIDLARRMNDVFQTISVHE